MDKGDSVGDNTPNSKDSGKHYIEDFTNHVKTTVPKDTSKDALLN
jgi:hypothetical protein